MLSQNMLDALNDQVNAELFSSYLYLSMSAHFETKNLTGMASWMRMQAQEESMHAMKFFDYINERGGAVVLTQIEAPRTEWSSILEVFEQTFEHECEVTRRINNLVDIAVTEKDHATNAFLQWLVTEQMEEEATAQGIVDKLKLIGEDGVAQYMLDKELGVRTAPASSGDAT